MPWVINEEKTIQFLEQEANVLTELAGWEIIDPDDIANTIIDSIFELPDYEINSKLKEFCDDPEGYVEGCLDEIGYKVVTSDYKEPCHFYMEVADDMQRLLEREGHIELRYFPTGD